jgi:CheY-like chemotaxis protein
MSKVRLLCVEDHQDTCELISVILKDYKVVSAYSMAEALNQATTGKFSLYLLDYHLPDGTGLELALLIRQFDPDTPIIFVTGTSQMTESQAKKIGANGLIKKGSPKFIEELANKVKQLLN